MPKIPKAVLEAAAEAYASLSRKAARAKNVKHAKKRSGNELFDARREAYQQTRTTDGTEAMQREQRRAANEQYKRENVEQVENESNLAVEKQKRIAEQNERAEANKIKQAQAMAAAEEADRLRAEKLKQLEEWASARDPYSEERVIDKARELGIAEDIPSDELFRLDSLSAPLDEARKKAVQELTGYDLSYYPLPDLKTLERMGYDADTWRNYNALAKQYGPEIAEMMLYQPKGFNAWLGGKGEIHPELLRAFLSGGIDKQQFNLLNRTPDVADAYLDMIKRIQMQKSKDVDYGKRAEELVNFLNSKNYFGYDKGLPNGAMSDVEDFLMRFATPDEVERFGLASKAERQNYLKALLDPQSPYVKESDFLRGHHMGFLKKYLQEEPLGNAESDKLAGVLKEYATPEEYERFLQDPAGYRTPYTPPPPRGSAELKEGVPLGKLWAYKQLFGSPEVSYELSSGVDNTANAMQRLVETYGELANGASPDAYKIRQLRQLEQMLFGQSKPTDTYVGRQWLLDKSGLYNTRPVDRPPYAVGDEFNPFVDKVWGRASKRAEVPTMEWDQLPYATKQQLVDTRMNVRKPKMPYTGKNETLYDAVLEDNADELFSPETYNRLAEKYASSPSRFDGSSFSTGVLGSLSKMFNPFERLLTMIKD